MTTEAPVTFGALLRRHRLAARLSQEALAERAGVSARAIRALEGGQRRAPYPHTVEQLARALRLPAADRARLEAAAPRRLAPASPGAAAPPPATNLPLALTSFIGRAAELAEVRRLLGTTRLLTLTGAGGVGKTRLALEAARATARHRDACPDGVWLVELAALADPALVAPAVAATMGVREPPGQSILTALTTALRARRLLLLLDNCEHLLDGCAPLVDALLRACPGVRVLATGREALGVPGEVAWRVPSLALPPPPGDSNIAALLRAESVRLFVDRAGAARPAFALTDRNAAAVVEICWRLDGIPLAIELAAARVAALSAEQVAARLDDRFRLLTGGGRTAPGRQRTLRATIDWSYDLLAKPERALFHRLAVFAGGWSLDAAEAVGAGDKVDGAAVLDVLARLVDKSLVLADERDGEARYRLLATVRQYAAEKLHEAGESAAVRARHTAWCRALAERVEPELRGPAQAAWLDRLDVEHDNLRAALAWCLEHDPAAGLRLAGRLSLYWRRRSSFTEGRRWLACMLARAPEPTAARVQALLGVAFLARVQGDHAATRAWNEEALALSRRLGDTSVIAEALKELGAVGFWSGDYRSARAWLEEARPLLQGREDRRDLGAALYFLGRVAEAQGDYARARASLEESLRLDREAGDLYLMSFRLRELGRVALCQGEAGQAQALLEEALACAGQVGSPMSATVVREYLGWVACWRGDLAGAVRLFEASLAGAREAEYTHGIAGALVGLGQVAWRRGDGAGARAWLAEGLALCQVMGHRRGSGAALHGLGLVAWQVGDAASATTHLTESLALRRDLGEPLGEAECLEALAAVAAGTGVPEPAARWLGAAETIRAAIGAPLPPVERPDYDDTLRQTRAALGEAAFAAAWAAGRALTVEQATAEALGDPSLPPVDERAAPVQPAAPNGLSRREVEVLRLVAAGRSNRGIAEELSVSGRTVERHITNIYGKIGARGRADAATFAVRHGLA